MCRKWSLSPSHVRKRDVVGEKVGRRGRKGLVFFFRQIHFVWGWTKKQSYYSTCHGRLRWRKRWIRRSLWDQGLNYRAVGLFVRHRWSVSVWPTQRDVNQALNWTASVEGILEERKCIHLLTHLSCYKSYSNYNRKHKSVNSMFTNIWTTWQWTCRGPVRLSATERGSLMKTDVRTHLAVYVQLPYRV